MQSLIIETYKHRETGYQPFLIREGWQVAQLNFMPEQDLFSIEKMDKHFLTDEAFILLKGVAILIAAREVKDDFVFECIRMERGIVYNIPVRQWHNIAMSKDASVIIVEKDGTHEGDFEFRPLTDVQKKQLNSRIGALLI